MGLKLGFTPVELSSLYTFTHSQVTLTSGEAQPLAELIAAVHCEPFPEDLISSFLILNLSTRSTLTTSCAQLSA
jgi:hypothetical protein